MKLREELAAARQDVHMWRMKWEKEAGKSEGLKSTAHAMQVWSQPLGTWVTLCRWL